MFAKVGEMIPPRGVPASVAFSWPIVDHASLQPFAQYRLVHGDVAEQPVMIDVIKAPFDVRFEYPLRSAASAQYDVALADRVGGGAAYAEPV